MLTKKKIKEKIEKTRESLYQQHPLCTYSNLNERHATFCIK